MAKGVISERAAEARVRRAARRLGLVVKKSRWRLGSLDNHGGYQVIDASTNFVVEGSRFELEVAAVAGVLAKQAQREGLRALEANLRQLAERTAQAAE